MGYGMAIAIDTKKMLKAIKVNKTVADCEKMVFDYRKKHDELRDEKSYILMIWACGVLEGAKMLTRGVHKRWSMYGITQEMVKGTVFENC